MKRLVSLAIGIWMTAILGCTRHLADFTIYSKQRFDPEKFATYKSAKKVSGEDKIILILFMYYDLQGYNRFFPNIQFAIDNALDKVPGAVGLLDASVSNTFWWFIPIFWGENYITIEGTALIYPSLNSTSFGNGVGNY